MLSPTAPKRYINSKNLGGKVPSSANNGYRRLACSLRQHEALIKSNTGSRLAPAKKKSPVYTTGLFVRKAENEPYVFLCLPMFAKLKIYQISNILTFCCSSMFIDNRKKCMKCVCKLHTRFYNHSSEFGFTYS